MIGIRKILLGGGLVLACSRVAEAGTLYTAPVSQSFPAAQTLCCTILNVSSGPRPVEMQVIEYDSNFVGGGSNGGLGSKEASRVCVPASLTGAYCKFVVLGSSRSYRAAAIYYDAAGVYTAAVPAE